MEEGLGEVREKEQIKPSHHQHVTAGVSRNTGEDRSQSADDLYGDHFAGENIRVACCSRLSGALTVPAPGGPPEDEDIQGEEEDAGDGEGDVDDGAGAVAEASEG